MNFPMEFFPVLCLFHLCFIWFVQIFTLLNVALSKTSFESIFVVYYASHPSLCITFKLQSASPRPPLALFSKCLKTGKQIFRIFLEYLYCLIKFLQNLRCTVLSMYNVHCNTYILGPSFNIFFLFFGFQAGKKTIVCAYGFKNQS
jgi:hypothetical protein